MLQRRLFATPNTFATDGSFHLDAGAFLERLLLFDTFVLSSNRLNEISTLVDLFGLDAVIRLFKSDAVEVQLGLSQTTVLDTSAPSRGRPYLIRAFPVWTEDREMAKNCLLELRERFEVQNLSKWRSITYALHQSIDQASLTPEEQHKAAALIGNDLIEAGTDSRRLLPYVERAAAHRGHTLQASEDDVSVEFINGTFVVDTNLAGKIGVSTEEFVSVLRKAFFGLGDEVHRVHHMRRFNALVPFAPSEASFYRSHLEYVGGLLDPARPSESFSRIVGVKGLPNLRHTGVAEGVNLHALIDARRSAEGEAFRRWIWSAADLEDNEIEEQLEYHVQSLGARFAALLTAPRGRRVRWVAATAAGFAFRAAAEPAGPLAAAAAGTIPGFANAFLLDRVLGQAQRQHTPAAFLEEGYQSLFKPGDR
ncbi:hypothetical protein [Rubrivirga marina]|uniref:Uncharacterized protein n=1 Tax=Rubrivirga marina TaxID=1196024 RepID=A0A271J4N3_9BACT|nr:hypothetical protein [Rubrivirga marina]PAP78014.1 hypothetical protein BSZ37_16985 [Rubrivirga marina]